MKDYIVKIVAPRSGVEFKMGKRGSYVLENTRNALGVSMMDELIAAVEAMPGTGTWTWKEIEEKTPRVREIFDKYASVYGL